MRFLLLHPSTVLLFVHVVVILGLGVRVIMRRPSTGVALAWLLMITTFPLGGAVAYLLVGEKRIGPERARRLARLRETFGDLAALLAEESLTRVDWSRHPPEAEAMDRLGRALAGLPTVRGCRGRMLDDTAEILRGIADDVAGARRSVLMEFYIWNEGGLADDVLEAVIAAAGRGVECRLLIDALGAAPWWKGEQPERLREAGVRLRPALPVGLIRTFVGRNDVRLHRKIVVIDGEIAWTGSMNMVDPRFFKQEAHVGQWVDAMVRVEGTVVGPLALTMIGDWTLETGEDAQEIFRSVVAGVRPAPGDGDAQIVPSGPGQTDDGLVQMILAVVQAAREELVLTTPYFVPDDALLRALRGAAARGVEVSMILPEKVDSLPTRYACQSYFDELAEVGVRILLYRDGLLHTKSITADRRIAMFGTVNLDMRSLWINYEVSAFVYDHRFGEHLRRLQQSYLDASRQLDPAEWAGRGFRRRLLENGFRLMSPLL